MRGVIYMKGRKETILGYCLKAFTAFVGFVAITGLLGLTFCFSWLLYNVSPQVSKTMAIALFSIMGIRMMLIYFGTHKAVLKIHDLSWKRRSLAVVYSMIPCVAGFTALKPVYANKRNI